MAAACGRCSGSGRSVILHRRSGRGGGWRRRRAAQAQVDWAHFNATMVGGEARDLVAFKMVLSHSRREAIVWSESKAMLAWLGCHTAAFRRLGGVPATVRIDNEKTGIAKGAGRLGRHQPELPALCDDAVLSCGCLSAAAAAVQRQGRAAGARPALRP